VYRHVFITLELFSGNPYKFTLLSGLVLHLRGFMMRQSLMPNANSSTKILPKSVLNSVQFIEVDEDRQGQRLDNFLFRHLKGVPKTHIYRIIRKGEVRINKKRVKQTTRLALGDIVRIPPIRISDTRSINIDRQRYEYLNHATLFEDDAFLIVNKPAGLAVHSGSGISVGLIEAMRRLRNDLAYLELVHRLDRETSGCLVLAKKASALRTLQADFRQSSAANSTLDKRYQALVKGRWRHGQRRIEKPLNTQARVKGERTVKVDQKGQYACSIAKPLATSKIASLIEVKLLTGRTHQVRVHCQSESHPLAGDQRYGDSEFNQAMRQLGLKRLFLHASSLSFVHPMTQTKIQIQAEMPEELSNLSQQLF